MLSACALFSKIWADGSGFSAEDVAQQLKLDEAEEKIRKGEEAWQKEQEEWKVERTNLTTAKGNAESAKASDACTDFCADVGQSSHKMGEDEALTKLRVALADSCHSADWNSVWSRYQELAEAEAAVIRAKMAEETSSDDEDDDDDEEAAEEGGSTEPPQPEIAVEQPVADPSTQLP
ncbi:hypothetical protein BVRB_4g085440 [Beta vulgaris subsp. vulgaris]|nr:hypothetical protein BVRB_4g085440 [Beta vulgaris subsp. vulgaris]